MGICCMAQETQTGTLYQPRGVGWGGRWVGGSEGRGYMYTYGWFMLTFDRKQQKSVKQLSFSSVQFSQSVVSDSFMTLWTTARQASLSITNSRGPPKPMCIESVMPSNHLALCLSLLLMPSIFPRHEGLFQWVSSSHQVAKILVFQLQHQFFQWTPRTDHILIQKIKQNIQKTKIRASSPVTSWRTDGETMVRMTDFIFLGSNVTVDSDCCYEIKRLLLGRKAMGNLYGVLKSRDITFLTKVYIVKAMVFPVVMDGWMWVGT